MNGNSGNSDSSTYNSRNSRPLLTEVCLLGVYEIKTTLEKNFGCIQFTQPVELRQIRILKIGSTIELKDSKFKSTTQSADIEEVLMFANSLGSRPQSPKMELLCKINKPGNLMSKDCIVPIPAAFYTDSLIIRGKFEVLSIAFYGTVITKSEIGRRPFDLADLRRKIDEKRKRGSRIISIADLQEVVAKKSADTRRNGDGSVQLSSSTLYEFVKENSLFDEINSNLVSLLQQLVDLGLGVPASAAKATPNLDAQISKEVSLQNDIVSELIRLYKETESHMLGTCTSSLHVIKSNLKDHPAIMQLLTNKAELIKNPHLLVVSELLNMLTWTTEEIIQYVITPICGADKLILPSSASPMVDELSGSSAAAQAPQTPSLLANPTTSSMLSLLTLWSVNSAHFSREQLSQFRVQLSTASTEKTVAATERGNNSPDKKRDRSREKDKEKRSKRSRSRDRNPNRNRSKKRKRSSSHSSRRSRNRRSESSEGSRRKNKKHKESKKSSNKDRDKSRERSRERSKDRRSKSRAPKHLQELDLFNYLLRLIFNRSSLSQSPVVQFALRLTKAKFEKDTKDLNLAFQVPISLWNFQYGNEEQNQFSTLETFCLMVIHIKLSEARLQHQKLERNLYSEELQNWVGRFQAHIGNTMMFRQQTLRALSRFDSLNRLLDEIPDKLKSEVVDRILASDWIPKFIFEVGLIKRDIEDEEGKLLESLMIKLMCFTRKQTERATAAIRALQKKKKLNTLYNFNQEDENSLTQYWYSLTNCVKRIYRIQESTELIARIKNPNQLKDYKETHLTDSMDETRARVSLFIEQQNNLNLTMTKFLLGVTHLRSRMLEPYTSMLPNLVGAKLFEPLMRLVDILTDIFVSSQSPASSYLESKTTVDRNPTMYAQLCLRCLIPLLEMFEFKISTVVLSQPNFSLYLNVELLHCCIRLYNISTADTGLDELKKKLDVIIEKIVYYLGLVQEYKLSDRSAATGSAREPAPKRIHQSNPFLTHLMLSFLKSSNPARLLQLLIVFLRNPWSHQANKPLSECKLETLFNPQYSMKGSSVGKVPLLSKSSELNALSIFDTLSCGIGEHQLLPVIDRALWLGEAQTGELLSLLILRGPDIVVEYVHEILLHLAEKRLASASLVWFRGFVSTLVQLAQNPVWKALCVGHKQDLCQLLHRYLDSEFQVLGAAGLPDPALAEVFMQKLILGTQFFATMMTREYGMFKTISKDTKYLFEDLPKETSITSFTKLCSSAFSPLLSKQVPLEQQCRSALSWLSLLDSLSASTVCQVILLWGMWASKPRHDPLVSLHSLKMWILNAHELWNSEASAETLHLVQTAVLRFVCLLKQLLEHPGTKKPFKSMYRLQAVERLLAERGGLEERGSQGDGPSFGSLGFEGVVKAISKGLIAASQACESRIKRGVSGMIDEDQGVREKSHLQASMQIVATAGVCEELLVFAKECSTAIDMESNMYEYNRDFHERLKLYKRKLDEKEDDWMRKIIESNQEAIEAAKISPGFICDRLSQESTNFGDSCSLSSGNLAEKRLRWRCTKMGIKVMDISFKNVQPSNEDKVEDERTVSVDIHLQDPQLTNDEAFETPQLTQHRSKSSFIRRFVCFLKEKATYNRLCF